MRPIPLTVALLAGFAPALAGQWMYEEVRDAMTDKVSWQISSFAQPVDDPAVMLNWWCNGGAVEVFLRIEKYLPGDSVEVQYRFDSDPASRAQRWEVSEPLVIAPSDVVADITGRARRAKKLLVRVTPDRGDILTYTFDIDGSMRAAEKAEHRRIAGELRYNPFAYMSDSLTFTRAYDRLPCKKSQDSK